MSEPSSFSLSSILSHVPFRRYIAGYFLFTLGQQMQMVTIGFEIYDRTHSNWALGLVNLMQVLPVFFLTLLTGHILDRFSRKKIFLLSLLGYSVTAICLFIVSLKKWPIPAVYVCMVFFGTARAFFAPARASILPQILPPFGLVRSLNISAGVWQLATVIGPALGGFWLARFFHPWMIYFFNAACAASFFLLLKDVSITESESKPTRITATHLFAGIRYVFQTKILLSVMTLDLFAVLFGGATTLLPVFAKEILHTGPTGLGFLRAAPSFGAVLATLLFLHRGPMKRAGVTLLFSVAGFGLATILFGASRSFGFSLLVLVILGGFDSISVVIRASLEQIYTPDSMRGRVSSITRLFIDLSNELGGFESGAVASLVGPVFCVVGGGVATLFVVLCAAVLAPSLRKLGALEK